MGYLTERWNCGRVFSEAHLNRALVSLITGDFQRGWPEYEWRAQVVDGATARAIKQRWAGEPLRGKRILLVNESTPKDNLQFIRYAKLLAREGATVIVQATEDLALLLKWCPYVDEVSLVDCDVPDHDFQIPIGSLPGAFKTTLTTIPTDTPYLVAEEKRVARWRNELSFVEAFKIGVMWQGEHEDKDRRAIPLTHFAPLAALPGVHLISMERGSARDQLSDAPFSITDLGARLDDSARTLVDLAAVLPNLDLVITADTTLAHLAGGVGASVWVAIPYAGDWRWLVNREDSPWYPTMRLFRQPEADDWAPVFERMASSLSGMLTARGEGKPALSVKPPQRGEVEHGRRQAGAKRPLG